MVIFVDLDAECELRQSQPHQGRWDNERAKLQLQQKLLAGVSSTANSRNAVGGPLVGADHEELSVDHIVRQGLNKNGMTAALRCYPYVQCISDITRMRSFLGVGLVVMARSACERE